MALAAATVFEINSLATASNVNGGGFNPANTHGITDGVIASGTGNSPTLTSASYSFVAGDVGAWIYFPTQSNMTAGWYQIASQSGGVATLSAAIGQAIQVSNNLYITNTVAGCATIAAPSGVTYLVDYSQSTTARYSAADLTGTTTSCTSATNPFTIQMVGNIIHLVSGTGVTADWYEIVSVSGVTATLDKTAGTTFSGVTYNTGGALSLGSSDDAVFELTAGSSTVSSRFFIKGGNNITYTLGGTVNIAAGGANTAPAIIEAYVTKRGNRPTDATRPTFNCGAAAFTVSGNYWQVNNIIFTSTGGSCLTDATSTSFAALQAYFCKGINKSSSAGQAAFTGGANEGSLFFACEGICYRGYAFNLSGLNSLVGCYAHDSNIGITAISVTIIQGCIIGGNVTSAIAVVATNSQPLLLNNNTLYGSESRIGIGINFSAGSCAAIVTNNIIYGFVTGVTHASTQSRVYSNYNDYFNNTNDVSSVTQFQKGPNDIAVNPSFTSVTQRTGATATTTSGNHLVQAGATFVTWGITAGVDYIYISAGTGVTAGIYGILSVDSETQITVDITLTANATADKVWSITQGHNFYPAGAI